MPISRYLLLIFGICLILGLMIWLVSSLSALYSQVIWSANPILANLLLLLLIILLGLAIFAFFIILDSSRNQENLAKNGDR